MDEYYKLMTQIISARRNPDVSAEMARRHAARTGGDGQDWEQALLQARGFASFEQLQAAVRTEIGEERREAYREAGRETLRQTPEDTYMQGLAKRGAGFMQSLGQGALLGGSDEVAGMYGGEMGREMSRGQLQQFRADSPLLSYTGEIGGGFAAPGLAGIKALRGGSTLVRALAKGAGVGAIEGGVAGALEGEGVAGRLRGAGIGAGVGGATGGLLSGVGYGGRRAFEALTGTVPGQTAAAQAKDVAQQVVGQTPRGTPGVIRAAEEMAQLVPGTPPAAVPELRGLTRAAVAASPEAAAIAQQQLPPLLKGSRRRTIQNLMEAVGEEIPPNTAVLKQQLAEQLTSTGPAYQALEEGIPSMPGMAHFWDNELVQQAWRRANALYSRGGKPLQRMQTEIGGATTRSELGIPTTGGSTTVNVPPDFRTAQLVKEELDDMVTAMRRTRPKASKEIARVRDQYRAAMYKQLSEYGDVQGEYFKTLEMGRGIEDGMNFMRMSPDDAAVILEEYATDEARRGFKLGAIDGINRAIEEQKRVGNVERFFNSEAWEKRLAMLIEDEPALLHFVNTQGVEKEIAATANRVLGGSETVMSARLAEMLRPSAGPEMLQRLFILPASPAVGSARLAAEATSRRIGKGLQQREQEVGGLLGRTLLGQPSTRQAPAMSLQDLLTGGTGDYSPGLLSYMMARSPAALVLALHNQQRQQQQRQEQNR